MNVPRGPGAEWIEARLPKRTPIVRRSEADYYGASMLVGSALGMAAPPRSCASWKHGVTYVRGLAHPELLLTEGNRLTRHLVTDARQADELRSRGFMRVHAVGAPFLHARATEVQRLDRSLLVMPAHSLATTAQSFDERTYADQIASLRARFDFVLVCISQSCIRQGHWTRAFEERGIPWIAGADAADGHALARMATLFATFECVTTNYLGSYVAYAAYQGCKVCIWGRFSESRLEDFKGVPWYEERWREVGELFEKSRETYVRATLPWLFRDPWEAQSRCDWAADVLGEPHRRPAFEMARLLGWTPAGQTEAALHDAVRSMARVQRAVARRLPGRRAS